MREQVRRCRSALCQREVTRPGRRLSGAWPLLRRCRVRPLASALERGAAGPGPWIAFQRDGREVSGLRPTALGIGLSGTAAALRQSLRVPNVHLDPRYLSCADGIDIRSELVVPLLFKDRLLGILDLESKEYDAFTSRHEQLLSTLAASLSIALENARLYEQVRQDEPGSRRRDLAQRIQQALRRARRPGCRASRSGSLTSQRATWAATSTTPAYGSGRLPWRWGPWRARRCRPRSKFLCPSAPP